MNVNKESTEQYPEHVCENCKRKLDMFSAKVGEHTSDFILIDFQPHSDTDCFACTKRQ